jgi:GntR family transcriptional regulator
MLLSVSPNGPVPIYEQIVAQVIYQVAAGALEAGALVPSVRELAEQLLVNPNTVARAFGELEREGVLVARRGRGMEVTAEGPRLCDQRRRDLIQGRIADALREAWGSALASDDIRKLVDEEWAKLNGRRPTRSAKS